MGSPTTDLQVAEKEQSQGKAGAGRVDEGREQPFNDTAAQAGQGRQPATGGIEHPTAGSGRTDPPDIAALRARLHRLDQESLVFTLRAVHGGLIDKGILTRKQLTDFLEERILVLGQSEEEIEQHLLDNHYRGLKAIIRREQEEEDKRQKAADRDKEYNDEEKVRLELQVKRWELQKEAFIVQREIQWLEAGIHPTLTATRSQEVIAGTAPGAPSTASTDGTTGLDRTAPTRDHSDDQAKQGERTFAAEQQQAKTAFTAETLNPSSGTRTVPSSQAGPYQRSEVVAPTTNSRNYLSNYKTGNAASYRSDRDQEESTQVTGREADQLVEEEGDEEDIELEWPFRRVALTDFSHVKVPTQAPEILQKYFGLICDVIDIISVRVAIWELYEDSYEDRDIERYEDAEEEEIAAIELQVDTLVDSQYNEKSLWVRDSIVYHLPSNHPKYKPLRESYRLEQIYSKLKILEEEVGKFKDSELKAIDDIPSPSDLLIYLPQPLEIQKGLADKLAQGYRNFLYIFTDSNRRRAEIDVTDTYRGILRAYKERQTDNEGDLQVLALKLFSPFRSVEEAFLDFTTFIGRSEFEHTGSWVRSSKSHIPHEYSHKLYYPSRKFVTHLTEKGLTIRFAEDISKPPSGKQFINIQDFSNHQIASRDKARTLIVVSTEDKSGSYNNTDRVEKRVAVPGVSSQQRAVQEDSNKRKQRSHTPPPRSSPPRRRFSNWDRREASRVNTDTASPRDSNRSNRGDQGSSRQQQHY